MVDYFSEPKIRAYELGEIRNTKCAVNVVFVVNNACRPVSPVVNFSS